MIKTAACANILHKTQQWLSFDGCEFWIPADVRWSSIQISGSYSCCAHTSAQHAPKAHRCKVWAKRQNTVQPGFTSNHPGAW